MTLLEKGRWTLRDWRFEIFFWSRYDDRKVERKGLNVENLSGEASSFRVFVVVLYN